MAYDENGDPVVLFEYDPSQTVWQVGHQNYPLSATYFDLLSKSWFPYTYKYENCGREKDNDDHKSQALPTSTASAKKTNPMMLLKRNPSKSIKEQVKELRLQLNNIKK